MKKIAVFALIAFACLSAFGNLYLSHKITGLAKNAPPADESAKIIALVGKLIELPQGQTPTIAMVDDPDQLRKQGLFQNAVKGDTVLIYPTEKKAILYRASENKIVDVTTVTITETLPTKPTLPPSTDAVSPAPTP